ncbi:Solute carrier family 35 member G1 [Orchesella cincta]|uniref:Solute carrier family 35 member G1 n=1 Tax=Orchesella cincta TaxID=48709 RepID=A0A1D2NA80_ORCCI|nr:Solute carrier family 35 member G1 [Orchesella cincta]
MLIWRNWFLIQIRAFCGVNALIFFFYAVKYLTVADAIVIDASSPIFVYVMASFLLDEKCGVLPVFTTIMAFIGVALITRPPLLTSEAEFDFDNLIGVSLAFSCMLCITFTIITLKFLENIFHGIVKLVFGLWGTIQCLIVSRLCGTLSVPSGWSDVWKILATAVLFYLGQAFITLALKYEDAGPVGLFRSTEVIFCFVWQFLFLGVVPDIYSCVGAFLVLLGVVLTILRKWINTLPSDNEFRNKCSFFLL